MPLRVDAFLVPSDWCIEKILPEAQRGREYVDVMIEGVELKPSKLLEPVFGGLTIGSLTGHGETASGSPTKIRYDDVLKAVVVVACANLRINRGTRPSPTQAVALFRSIEVPMKYGHAVYRFLGHRVLDFIDRFVSTAQLPNALAYDDKKHLCWKQHTSTWQSGITTLQQINDEQSDLLRPYQPAQTSLGMKRIMDEVMQIMTGAKGGPKHFDNILIGPANNGSYAVEVENQADTHAKGHTAVEGNKYGQKTTQDKSGPQSEAHGQHTAHLQPPGKGVSGSVNVHKIQENQASGGAHHKVAGAVVDGAESKSTRVLADLLKSVIAGDLLKGVGAGLQHQPSDVPDSVKMQKSQEEQASFEPTITGADVTLITQMLATLQHQLKGVAKMANDNAEMVRKATDHSDERIGEVEEVVATHGRDINSLMTSDEKHSEQVEALGRELTKHIAMYDPVDMGHNHKWGQ